MFTFKEFQYLELKLEYEDLQGTHCRGMFYATFGHEEPRMIEDFKDVKWSLSKKWNDVEKFMEFYPFYATGICDDDDILKFVSKRVYEQI